MTDERTINLLHQMKQAAEDAISYVEGMTREEFLGDRKTEQAVVMNLVIIGEVAVRIMDGDAGFAEAHPEVPWREMRGMRNRIAHGYFEMDMGVVWDTVQRSLPELLPVLQVLIKV